MFVVATYKMPLHTRLWTVIFSFAWKFPSTLWKQYVTHVFVCMFIVVFYNHRDTVDCSGCSFMLSWQPHVSLETTVDHCNQLDSYRSKQPWSVHNKRYPTWRTAVWSSPWSRTNDTGHIPCFTCLLRTFSTCSCTEDQCVEIIPSWRIAFVISCCYFNVITW